MTGPPEQANSGASLIGGHAQYVKGAAEGAVASVLEAAGGDSKTWTKSAESDQQGGIDSMKAASAERDSQQHGLGKVEELAGKAVGCEGMEKEGAATTNEEPPKST